MQFLAHPMVPLETKPSPAGVQGRRVAAVDARAIEKVRAVFASLSKYISAKTVYASNNPNLGKIAASFHDSFRAYFEIEKELSLAIRQYQILWRNEVVYQNDQKTESIAFLFYKDGVGEITIQSQVSPAELEQFVDVLRGEIYSPSSHMDIVGRLWQSSFTNIFYRVYDESSDGAPGDGRGSGSDAKEEPLRVNDHPAMPDSGDATAGGNERGDLSIEPIGAYFRRLAAGACGGPDERDREMRLEELLETHFVLRGDELASWRERLARANERNKILWLLDIMLDFTRQHNTPAAVRDVRDIIERLVRSVVEDVDIPTLIALLDVQKRLAAEDIEFDFQDLPGRMKEEVTSKTFLISLGKFAQRSNADALSVLEYFRAVGKDAVPGVCELLAGLKDPSMHKNACDTLIAIAGDEVRKIVDELNLDNPCEAKDAVYLLGRFAAPEVPAVIHKVLASADIEVREHAIGYLAVAGGDEAARLLCRCLDDSEEAIRVKTLSAVEDFRHPLLAEKVVSMCFSDDKAARSGEEVDRMFRALGKLAGESALPRLREMAKSRNWLPFGKARAKHEKLLALTALRHIPGPEASRMIEELAGEGDALVKTKAACAMRQRRTNNGPPAEEASADDLENIKR